MVPIEVIALNTIRRLEGINGIQVRHVESIMQTMVTTVAIDRTYSITVELKDDTKGHSEEAIGLATFLTTNQQDCHMFRCLKLYEIN